MLHLDATHIGAGGGVEGVLLPASRVVELLVPASGALTGVVVGVGVLTIGVLVPASLALALVLVLGTLAALLLWLTLLGLAGPDCAGACGAAGGSTGPLSAGGRAVAKGGRPASSCAVSSGASSNSSPGTPAAQASKDTHARPRRSWRMYGMGYEELRGAPLRPQELSRDFDQVREPADAPVLPATPSVRTRAARLCSSLRWPSRAIRARGYKRWPALPTTDRAAGVTRRCHARFLRVKASHQHVFTSLVASRQRGPSLCSAAK